MSTDTCERESKEPASEARCWPSLVLYLLVPLVIAALMLYYLISSRRVAGEFGFPLDDSWIHLRFAQNLARGYGFSFNPGQPASTSTGPLWTLLFALGYRATGEYVFTAAAANWALCWLTAVTAAALGHTLMPSRALGAAIALIVAVTIPLPWLALSGMEPPLFMWLTLVAVLLHVRLRRAHGAGGLAPTIASSLAVYARPELLLLFPLAMLDRLLRGRREEPGERWFAGWLRQLAIHTPIYLAIVAPLSLYNLHVIGRPLPSSYYIKAMNYGITWALAMGNDELLLQSLFLAPVKEVFALLLLWAGNNVVLFVPFLLGFVWLVRETRSGGASGHGSYLIPLLLVVQPIAWAISTNFHRAPWFQSQRYLANLGPLYLIVGMVGASKLIGRMPRGRRVAVIGGLALALVASLARQPDQARLYAQNVKNITELQVAAARWLKERVSSEAVIAANDVGAVAVITQCRIFDMMGLVSPETLACLTVENARAGTWRQCVEESVVSAEPDYLFAIARPERLAGFARNPYYGDPVYLVEVDDNITAGGPVAVILPTIWCKYAASSEAAPGGP